MLGISSVRPAEIKIQAMFRGQQSRNQQLLQAAKIGDIKRTENLIKHGAKINATNKNGETALYLAIKYNHVKAVEELVKAGADVNVKDKYGLTALYWASQNGHKEIVELLLEKGANIEATEINNNIWKSLQLYHKTTTTDNGKTALHVAVLFGRADIVELLLEKGANIEATEDNGKTALHVAVLFGRADIVKALVIAGADVNATNNDGETALDLAKKYGHYDKVKNAIKEGKQKLISLYENQQCQLKKVVNSPIYLQLEDLEEPLLQNAPEKLNETQIQQAIKYRKEKKIRNYKFFNKNIFSSIKFF